MIFEEGQIFNKDGVEFCVLDTIEYNGDNYVLMSIETGEKGIGFSFYHISLNNNEYELEYIDNEEINNTLLSLYEEKNNEEL